MLYMALSIVPAWAIAMTTARRHHAVMSPLAALAREMVPKCVLVSPFSWMMRASTGNAVILIAIPTKRANDRNGVPLSAYLSYTK